jgi:prepilin-type N-terminal cleavage/methylation domain-containing protein
MEDKNKIKLLINSNSGFTLVEVVISTVIFTIVAAGLYASVSTLRKPAMDTTKKINASFVGKQILEELRNDVSADTWNNGGPLVPSGTPYVLPDVTVGGITYHPQYIVENDPDGSPARKVTLTITW